MATLLLFLMVLPYLAISALLLSLLLNIINAFLRLRLPLIAFLSMFALSSTIVLLSFSLLLGLSDSTKFWVFALLLSLVMYLLNVILSRPLKRKVRASESQLKCEVCYESDKYRYASESVFPES